MTVTDYLDDPLLSRLEKIRSFFYFIVSFIVIWLALFLFYFDAYPKKDAIFRELYYEPVQTPTRARPFHVQTDENIYEIVPKYNYELYGMVVSTNNKLELKFLLKAFPWEDFLNVNDLCVIWGNNIASGVYRSMDFSQGEFTCYPSAKKGREWEAARRYDPSSLGHNHLLSTDKRIKRELLKAQKGDQIYLKGKLAAYYNEGRLIRDTSATRDDNVCETVFLEDFKILKPAHPVINFLKFLFFGMGLLSLLGIIVVDYRIAKIMRKKIAWSDAHLYH